MKTIFSSARASAFAVIFTGLLAGIASATPNPIPGVDIIVKKNPGGRVIHATTDKSGQFIFDNLPAGQYVLSVTPPQLKAAISTTRSNIKRPSMSMERGVQVANVAVELGTGAATTEIEITAANGRITGAVKHPDIRTPVPKSSEGK